MTTKVYDTFVGTNGTDLSAHTPDTDVVGGGWSQSPANGLELDGSGAAKWASSGDIAAIDSGSTDQRVGSNFNAGGADNRMSLFARFDGNLSSRTAYQVNWRPGDTGGQIYLYRDVAGSSTQIGNVAYTASTSTTYLVELEVIGTAIKVYIDSVEELSTTDSTITTGDYSGLLGALRSSANGRWHDFTVDDTAAGGLSIPIAVHHMKNQGMA